MTSESRTPRIEGVDQRLLDSALVQAGGFMDYLGLEFDLLSPDRVEAHIVTDARHQQPYGIVHGGVYCSIVEALGSIGASLRAFGDGNVVVGVSNSTDFLRPHREGRLDLAATPVHAGRTQQLWDVRINRPDGKLVARGQVRLQAVPKDRALAGRPALQPQPEGD